MTEPTIKEKMEKLLTDETFNPEPCNIRLFATNIARLIYNDMHLCTENPCPIQDIERLKFLENGYKTTYSMTTLEQFNEEVMKEFKEEFGEMIEAVRVETGVHYLIPDWITQKLTEHKALILKMVREKAEDSNGYGEFLDDLKTL